MSVRMSRFLNTGLKVCVKSKGVSEHGMTPYNTCFFEVVWLF